MQTTRYGKLPKRVVVELSVEISLPSDAHTHGNVGVGAERNTLFARLAQDMVHTDKEVVAFRMDVQYITHACRETVYGKIDAAVEPLQWLPVCTQSPFSP